MILEDWFLFSIPVTSGDDFESSERSSVLGGRIYHHPDRLDGSFFISDGLVAANHALGVVATQSGLVLTLGKVSGSSEMITPGIRDFLLTGLPQDPNLTSQTPLLEKAKPEADHSTQAAA